GHSHADPRAHRHLVVVAAQWCVPVGPALVPRAAYDDKPPSPAWILDRGPARGGVAHRRLSELPADRTPSHVVDRTNDPAGSAAGLWYDCIKHAADAGGRAFRRAGIGTWRTPGGHFPLNRAGERSRAHARAGR